MFEFLLLSHFCQFSLSVSYKYCAQMYVRHQFSFKLQTLRISQQWLVQNKPLVNQLEERLHVNNWQPKPLANLHQQLEELRSLIVIVLVPSLFVRFVVIRNRQSCSSANCHSNVSSVRSLKISRLTCVSNHQLSWHFKKHPKLISSVCSKIPTCALFTPRELQLCQKTFNWLVVFVVNVLKLTSS